MAGDKNPSSSLVIANPPYLADHRAEGRSILPAVEALAYLARAAAEHRPGLDVHRSRLAEFLRFLPLPAEVEAVEAEAEFQGEDADSLTARLVTRVKAGSAGISRSMVHVEVEFGRAQPLALPPADTMVGLEGIACTFDAAQLYADMVPFGPSFHNVIGTVHLAESGAVARIRAADLPAPAELLGNPFVLDAAFHLACAWGQRYAGVLTFPTGYTERVVAAACRSGETYFCRVVPVDVEPELLIFDLYLFEESGALAEACLGVKMQDVAQGRMKPCAWVAERDPDPLADLRNACPGLVVVELSSLAPFYDQVYSARERGRDLEMGAKRSLHFGGARVALKLLARRIGMDLDSPASALQTVAEDRVHPLLALPAGDPIRFCAAAHDARFAVAVGSDVPIGVDVEEISDRVLAAQRIYLSQAEQNLVRDTDLPRSADCALRMWTIKEAGAKALDIPLAKAFSRVQVREVGPSQTLVQVDDHRVTALHAVVDDHLFTLLQLPDRME